MKVSIGKFHKYSPNRRISIQIDDYDTWSLDNTLAYIIYPALLQFKMKKIGVPASFATIGGEDYSVQKSFDFYTESYNDAFNERVNKWDLILDKMIWAFQQLSIMDYEDRYHTGDPEITWVPTDTKIHNPITGNLEEILSMECNNKSYFYDKVGFEEHENRIQEGLDLFGKYYRHLWE